MNNPYRPPESLPRAPGWAPSAQASINTAWVHLGLACFEGAIALLVAGIVFSTHHDLDDALIALALFGVPILMHAAICVGARRRRQWARGASRAVGLMMLVAFPIGTLIGIYLLRNASKTWQAPVA